MAASSLGCVRQVKIVLLHFGSEHEASFPLDLVVGQLLAAGLHRKIGLPKRDDFLARVRVLDDQVAGVPRHHHGVHRTLGAAANPDHFGDSNEMVVNSKRPRRPIV